MSRYSKKNLTEAVGIRIGDSVCLRVHYNFPQWRENYGRVYKVLEIYKQKNILTKEDEIFFVCFGMNGAGELVHTVELISSSISPATEEEIVNEQLRRLSE